MGENIHYIALSVIIFLNSCMGDNAYGPMRGQGGGWPWMMHYGFGGILMWIIFLILVGAVLYVVISSQKGRSAQNESPLDILKKRYARGEITKEEFDKMKRNLQE